MNMIDDLALPIHVVDGFFGAFAAPDYLSRVFETATGIFWEAPKSAAWGTWEMIKHPIQTVEGIYVAITHPRETLTALKDELVKTFDTGSLKEQGKVVGDVLMIFLPTPKFVEKVGDVAKLGARAKEFAKKAQLLAQQFAEQADRIVDKLLDVAKLNPRLVLVQAGSGKIVDLGEAKNLLSQAKLDFAKKQVEKIPNKVAGDAREVAELAALLKKHPSGRIQKECYLRDKDGAIVIDPLTGEGRRIDFAVIEDKKIVDLVETTSETADKASQTAKEERIRRRGGVYIRDRVSGELIDVSGIPTRLSRRE